MLQTEHFKDDFYKLVLCECRRELELKEYDKTHDEEHHNQYKLQDSHRAVVPPVVKRESGFKKREQGTSSWEKKRFCGAAWRELVGWASNGLTLDI